MRKHQAKSNQKRNPSSNSKLKRNYRKTKATARNGSPKSSRVRKTWHKRTPSWRRNLDKLLKKSKQKLNKVKRKLRTKRNKLKRTLVKRTKQLRKLVKSSLKTTVNLVRKLITL